MSVIVERTENLFDYFPEMILHPVNTVSVGRDPFSKQIRKVFPEYFRHYQRLVLRKHIELAKPNAVELDSLFGTRTCVILPIQGHWREPVVPVNVKAALEAWKPLFVEHKCNSLGVPEFEGPPASWLERHLKNLLAEIPWSVTVYLQKPSAEQSELS